MEDNGQNGLLEDMTIDAELEGFLSGDSSNMVNLQPKPMAFGSSMELPESSGKIQSEAGGGVGSAISAAAAAAAATALMGGNFSAAGGVVQGAVSSIAAGAVPTSFQPVKERAGQFLGRAQPWRDFLLPLSLPAASDVCSRITANVYSFQTNYAILFVTSLLLAILLQPSALISLGVTALVWMGFMKKNEDPDWKPVVGGMELGPMQRWLALASSTAILLLFMAGGTIFNTALMYCFVAIAHGIVHDPAAREMPGQPSVQDIPL